MYYDYLPTFHTRIVIIIIIILIGLKRVHCRAVNNIGTYYYNMPSSSSSAGKILNSRLLLYER